MSTTNRDICVESALPVVSSNGLNTNTPIDFSNAATCALPAATTVGGSAIVSLASITSSITSGSAFDVTGSGIYAGTGLETVTANSATTGNIVLYTANGLTTGSILTLSSTGTIATTGSILKVTANSATSSTGVVRVSATAITSGTVLSVTGGTSLTGTVATFDMGAATAGNGLAVVTTGVYATGSSGLINVTANSATTTTGLVQVSATGLTSGSAVLVTGGGANLTSGGKVLEIVMGAATTGAGLTIANTGAFTNVTTAVLNIVASTGGTVGNIVAVTTISPKALMIGQVITTPAFQVDASTASQVAGLKVTGAATGGVVALAAIDSGADASISISPKGAGNVSINTPLERHTPTAQNTSATLTAAQVKTGYITSTSGAAVSLTLPTGTALGTALGAVQGTIHELYIDNTAGANPVTMIVSVNGVLSDAAVTTAASFGQLTVASGVTGLARFTLMFSSATAFAFTRTA